MKSRTARPRMLPVLLTLGLTLGLSFAALTFIAGTPTAADSAGVRVAIQNVIEAMMAPPPGKASQPPRDA